MKRLERGFTCINIQELDNENIDNVYRRNHSDEDLNSRNAENVEEEAEKPAKIRRHLPAPSGPYSVGCVDIMDNSQEESSFFRLYYPVQKTDIFFCSILSSDISLETSFKDVSNDISHGRIGQEWNEIFQTVEFEDDMRHAHVLYQSKRRLLQQRNTQWPLWLPRKQYAHGYAHFLKQRKIIGKLFNWIGGDIYVPALWQAPLVDSNSPFPVVILSHGIGGNRTTYSTYCCELASHGYVVAAPEHRDGSASTTYLLKDNMLRNTVELIKDYELGKHKRQVIHRSHSFKEEWKPFEHTDPLGIKWDDFKYRNQQVQVRATECSRVLDVLTSINKGHSVRNFLGFHFSLKQFKDRMDMSKAVIIGHSFGGSTCVSTLAKDKRFKVGVMLDAWMHPIDRDTCTHVTQPVVMVNYEKFQWQKNVDKMKLLHSKSGIERHMITIKGACHQAISDFQFICGKTFGRLMEVRSDLSPKTAMELNCNATLAFLSKHIDHPCEGINDSVLRGEHDLVVLGSPPNLPENKF